MFTSWPTSDIAALGIPGASNFKPEMVSSLLPFNELALIQEPGPRQREVLLEASLTLSRMLSTKSVVRAITLPEKDSRALWLTSKDKAQFTAALNQER